MKRLPQYEIYLNRSAGDRLSDFIRSEIGSETGDARKLFAEAKLEFKDVSALKLRLIRGLYWWFDGPFMEEMKLWARALNAPVREVIVANCGYELDHAAHAFSFSNLFRKVVTGCTTAVLNTKSFGPVHLRTLDWGLKNLGPATRLLRYHNSVTKHQSIVLGFPASVGALSGMVPGKYSVTINWAPPKKNRIPDFHYSASLLLLETLCNCPTYEKAFKRLTQERISSSVFFTICGVKPEQCFVIERNADEYAVRGLDDADTQVQSNHFITFNNDDTLLDLYRQKEELMGSTFDRRKALIDKLACFDRRPSLLTDMLSLLEDDPITNAVTVQRMALCPAKSEIAIDCLDRTESAEPKISRFIWDPSMTEPKKNKTYA